MDEKYKIGNDKKSMLVEPTDLVDFYYRWNEFRPLAMNAQARTDCSGDERMALDWLIKLADRIGVNDIN